MACIAVRATPSGFLTKKQDESLLNWTVCFTGGNEALYLGDGLH